MRHTKHRYILGVKKEHRIAMMANLASALFQYGKITTTLAKAKALRPFAEKLITLAKKAAETEDAAKKVHYRRLAIARVRDVSAVHKLFTERVQEFMKRAGGYTRIYKLVQRRGDAAPMAIIELINASDKGYKSSRRKAGTAKRRRATKAASAAAQAGEEVAATVEAATSNA